MKISLFLGLNLRTVQGIQKGLDVSNGDYESMAVRKPQSKCSGKKITLKFVAEIKAMIDNDPRESIRSIAWDIGESEFHRQVMHDIRYTR